MVLVSTGEHPRDAKNQLLRCTRSGLEEKLVRLMTAMLHHDPTGREDALSQFKGRLTAADNAADGSVSGHVSSNW
jgi:hypothetical protein